VSRPGSLGPAPHRSIFSYTVVLRRWCIALRILHRPTPPPLLADHLYRHNLTLPTPWAPVCLMIRAQLHPLGTELEACEELWLTSSTSRPGLGLSPLPLSSYHFVRRCSDPGPQYPIRVRHSKATDFQTPTIVRWQPSMLSTRIHLEPVDPPIPLAQEDLD